MAEDSSRSAFDRLRPAGGPGAAVGVIANPMSGRDVRRMAARARRELPSDKRNQIARAVVGAVASGATRFVLMRDCFRIAESAVECFDLAATFEFVDAPIETTAADTAHAAAVMRQAGCAALLVLGGDGTNRVIAKAWPDAPLVAMSTGTNNVIPEMVEATVAGAAAGLIASGAVALADVAPPSKLVRVCFADGSEELALVDVVLLEGDHIGSLMPFEPSKVRRLVLARAEPGAVGMSPIGGLVQPCGRHDAFGVEVRCTDHQGGGRALRVPVSPGLYRTAHVAAVRKLALGEEVVLPGPGILAVDGDRVRELGPGEEALAWVEGTGPRQIDVALSLRRAAESGHYFDRGPWRDGSAGGGGLDCC